MINVRAPTLVIALHSAAEPNTRQTRILLWVPKRCSVLGRKLSFFNEGRREAVDQRTRLSNPVNPLQLARYREAFSPGGAKDDRPDSELLCELPFSVKSF